MVRSLGDWNKAAIFHSEGIMIETLKSRVMEGVIDSAVYLSIRTDISSGPELLSTFRDPIRSRTSSSEHNKSLGHKPGPNSEN